MSCVLNKVKVWPFNESALIVQLGADLNPIVHQRVLQFVTLLEETPFVGFIECVPAYLNVTVYYDPYKVYESQPSHVTPISPFEIVRTYINGLLHKLNDDRKRFTGQKVVIPVLYGSDYGPDLEYVANYHNLSMEDVIRIHTEKEYLVYMLGFAPGFPFIGGMSKQIATPRKSTPRLTIAPGSVGIAGAQTGVYPLETPGGWQIIGCTPIDLFLPNQVPPSLLKAGDTIQFVSISLEEYRQYRRGGKENE
ncbi:5-oxoprolinase subunit PxpB [Virgibacillus dokdonensis]|uniref:5-oxoprolinase subunit PxpB n=1 Tax=Virgibacillus dokdonensis TaxID=302167 RepID=A0A2K9IUU6_9BACI|nr:5-oxoprolinase subunit PxpB [Virgibacillus dokdonensis]AUJ23235.1 Kinase A inhibitor [Virgibacillus dokdonensis]